MKAKAAVFMLVFLIFAGSALACSCVQPPAPEEALSQASAVFSGKVIAKDIDNALGGFEQIATTLQVDQAWKGVEQAHVVLHTASNSAACGVNLEIGSEYLVYATENEGQLHTSLCSRTAPLENAQEDLDALGAGQTVEVDTSVQEDAEDLLVSDNLFIALILALIAVAILILIAIARTGGL